MTEDMCDEKKRGPQKCRADAVVVRQPAGLGALEVARTRAEYAVLVLEVQVTVDDDRVQRRVVEDAIARDSLRLQVERSEHERQERNQIALVVAAASRAQEPNERRPHRECRDQCRPMNPNRFRKSRSKNTNHDEATTKQEKNASET